MRATSGSENFSAGAGWQSDRRHGHRERHRRADLSGTHQFANPSVSVAPGLIALARIFRALRSVVLYIAIEDAVKMFFVYAPEGPYRAKPALAKTTSSLPFFFLICSKRRSRSSSFATSPEPGDLGDARAGEPAQISVDDYAIEAVVCKNKQAGKRLRKEFHRTSVPRFCLENLIFGQTAGGIQISNIFG
jgi:hypothetical protein